MTANLEAPLDKTTGLALPIFFTPEDLELKGRKHHPNHPEKREEFKDSIGKALRYSRVHWVPDILHMGNQPGSYHRIMWGPWMTKDISTAGHKHRLAVLNCAGVVPRYAIEPDRQGGFQTRKLDDSEHALLADSRITHVEGNSDRQRQFIAFQIGHGLIEYALSQDADELASRKVQEKFVNAHDEAIIKELGNLMIYRAVEDSVKPIESMYQLAQEAGMVHRPRSLRNVVRSFLPEHEFGQYYKTIKNKILVNEELRADTELSQAA